MIIGSVMAKITNHLANAVTIGNIISGFASIIFTLGGDYTNAVLAIFAALLFDGLDGRVARFLDNTTEFGRELDSLSDVVSFGVAPALLVYSTTLSSVGLLGAAASASLVVAGAIRLARFNLLKGLKYFMGLPIPVAGVFISALIYTETKIAPKTLAVLVIIIAYLMISKVKYPSFKQNIRSRNLGIFLLVFALFLGIVLAMQPNKLLVAPFLFYIAEGPVLEMKNVESGL